MDTATHFTPILEQVLEEVRPLTLHGKVASYIPELSHIDRSKLGMALYLPDGGIYTAGDAHERFSIQSISKVFTLVMAYRTLGNALWERVGREPSGNPFNSLVQLETDKGVPRNPFINAGALVVTDILCSQYVNPHLAILEFIRQVSGVPDINFNTRVARSEAQHGFRNAAMANFIKSFGNLKAPVDNVLQAYFHQCSIEMSCAELVRAAQLLVHYGTAPGVSEALLTPSEVRRVASIMLTCGTYDAAGDFAFRIGLPAKSGVGGGILAVVPGRMALCVWSPALDVHGNSLAGAKALELFAGRTGFSIF
ncbi:glutaminase [Herbaspirillum chlorophenolicum]|uniref:Glutaminase n=1 Tax=Herbaspirillum chlorophenolicum TaxID=211589 RepID=A0ABW8F1W5_9BURK